MLIFPASFSHGGVPESLVPSPLSFQNLDFAVGSEFFSSFECREGVPFFDVAPCTRPRPEVGHQSFLRDFFPPPRNGRSS